MPTAHESGLRPETPQLPDHRGAAAVAPGCLPEDELLRAAQERMHRDWTEVKLRLNRNLFF